MYNIPVTKPLPKYERYIPVLIPQQNSPKKYVGSSVVCPVQDMRGIHSVRSKININQKNHIKQSLKTSPSKIPICHEIL